MSASRVRKNANTRTRVHSRRTGISSKSKCNGALQDTCSHANGAPANAGETERRLNRTIGELRHFIESASLGMHWVGPDGIILWANAADMDLLGYGRDDYIGHHIAEFHADPPVIEEILERLSRGEKVHEYEARLKCKDGSIKNVLINSSVYWEDGKFIHTQCFTRD